MIPTVSNPTVTELGEKMFAILYHLPKGFVITDWKYSKLQVPETSSYKTDFPNGDSPADIEKDLADRKDHLVVYYPKVESGKILYWTVSKPFSVSPASVGGYSAILMHGKGPHVDVEMNMVFESPSLESLSLNESVKNTAAPGENSVSQPSTQQEKKKKKIVIKGGDLNVKTKHKKAEGLVVENNTGDKDVEVDLKDLNVESEHGSATGLRIG